METHYYNRHSVHNIVDLIISGRDSELKEILYELKQRTTLHYTKTLKS